MKRKHSPLPPPAKKAKKSQKMRQVTIASWNICGFRALLKKNTLPAFLTSAKPDILCFNETMLQDKHVPEAIEQLPEFKYHYFTCSQAKKGYSGVAVLTKEKPISVEMGMGVKEHDVEGRLITAEFADFILVSTYVPNAGAGLVRLEYRTLQWDVALRNYLNTLQQRKPVIWLGDLNVVHGDIDIYDIRGKEDWACCTPAERSSFGQTLQHTGMIDTYRTLHPGARGYSYYSRRNVGAREKKQGWRLDYIVASAALENKLKDAFIMGDVMGSDHHPVLAKFEF